MTKDPGETTNLAETPEHGDAMIRFRERLAQLGHGPNADPNHINAGYNDTP